MASGSDGPGLAIVVMPAEVFIREEAAVFVGEQIRLHAEGVIGVERQEIALGLPGVGDELREVFGLAPVAKALVAVEDIGPNDARDIGRGRIMSLHSQLSHQVHAGP